MAAVESFHEVAQKIPDTICVFCGEHTSSQLYSLVLDRPHVTRKWSFCSLKHLRQWARLPK